MTVNKWILVTDSLSGYGAERVLADLTRAAQACGRAVVVICLSPSVQTEVALPPAVKVKYRSSKRSGMLINFLHSVWFTRRQLMIEGPGCVMGFLPIPNLVALLASRAIPGLTVITSDHNDRDPDHRSNIWRTILSWLLYPIADARVAVTHSVAESVGKTIHLDPSARIAHLAKQRVEASKGLQHQPILIVVSRLERKKRVDVAIRMMRAESLRKMHLAICGDGPELERLRSLALNLGLAKRVHFLGYQANPYPLIAPASVLVHPSVKEGFGLVLGEAACLGVPVAVSPIPVMRELVPSVFPGVVADGLEPEDLARAVETAMELSPSDRTIPDVVDRLSPARVWAEYEGLLSVSEGLS